MRLAFGVLLAPVLLLGGCASPESTDQPAGDAVPTSPSPGPVEFEQVAVVASSAVGGAVAPEAVDLTDETALADFLGQFENSRMATALERTIAEADVADDQTLAGAVVAVGCLPPEAVSVELTDSGLEIVAVPDKQATAVECLLPVTSVGVVAVDASLV